MCCATFGIVIHLLSLSYFAITAATSMITYCGIWPARLWKMFALHGAKVKTRLGFCALTSLQHWLLLVFC